MNYLLYNPLARNGQGENLKNEAISNLKNKFSDLEEVNVVELDVQAFITDKLKPEDSLILVGGDGTLNKFANNIYEHNLTNDFYLYRAGTGNDFLKDLDVKDNIVKINDYLKKLPTITVNGQKRYYINGIGYGIDGMVCVVADDKKAKGEKNINYTSISINLLLFKYKCPNARVVIDGKEYKFKKVWLASSMNGRYYGGGMRIAPEQDRLSGKITFVTMHNSGRIKTLLMFKKIFTGDHVKHKKNVFVAQGNKIEVYFDKPMALQIDGEVVENVTSYVAEI